MKTFEILVVPLCEKHHWGRNQTFKSRWCEKVRQNHSRGLVISLHKWNKRGI